MIMVGSWSNDIRLDMSGGRGLDDEDSNDDDEKNDSGGRCSGRVQT